MCIVLVCAAAFAQCPCGDIDGDCIVDFNDLNILSLQWLSSCGADPWCADLDGSDLVDFNDYALLAFDWGSIGQTSAIYFEDDFNDGNLDGWTVHGDGFYSIFVLGDWLYFDRAGGTGEPYGYAQTSFAIPSNASNINIKAEMFKTYGNFEEDDYTEILVGFGDTPSWTSVYRVYDDPADADIILEDSLIGQATKMWLRIAIQSNSGAEDMAVDNVIVGSNIVPLPGVPYDPDPCDGAIGVSIDANMIWTSGPDTETFDVYLGTDFNSVFDANRNSPEFKSNQPFTQYFPGTLLFNTTYYWRIDGVNNGGTTTGDVWSFTTETWTTAPEPASNPQPFDSATGVSTSVDLQFEAGRGATSHDIYFGTVSPGTFQINQPQTTFDPGSLDPNTTYYWRIDEKNSYGTTTGTVWSFTTSAGIGGDPASFLVNRVLPSDSGALNVLDYGAVGDGVHNDTSAIQSAMNNAVDAADSKDGVVYLPNGTYLVTSRLEWPSDAEIWGLALQGQNTYNTVIKLKDNLGFSQAVVWTQDAGSADNFRNYVRNLTIDTGVGNPGASGLEFMSNNNGAVFDVIIQSGGGGDVGLDFSYNGLNGPLLAKHVKIIGFNIGVKASGGVNSQTMEHIILEGQSSYGIRNDGQVFSVRKVYSDNSCPAVYHTGGVLTLLDSELVGGSGGNDAVVVTGGRAFIRNVSSSGYNWTVNSTTGHGGDVTGTYAGEFTTHDVLTLWPQQEQSLNLPIVETPYPDWEQDPNKWANVMDYGATGDKVTDDSAAIQAAIDDANKTTIYFPTAKYRTSSTIFIRGNISRIVGMLSVFYPDVTGMQLVDSPGSPSVVELDNVSFTSTTDIPPVINVSSRTLILKCCKGMGAVHTGSGDIFMEDVVPTAKRYFEFNGGGNIWCRHINCEYRNFNFIPHTTNDGSTLWILGYKTEWAGVLLDTKNGGSTEVCGHFCYAGIGEDCDPYPIYINDESSLSMTMGLAHNSTRTNHEIIVSETQNGQTRELLMDDVGKDITLYVGAEQ